MAIRVGHIFRHEDETGVSGTGIVAEFIEFSDGEVVVHWLSHTPSTNHYRNYKQVAEIHGHNGKTELVVVWEETKPDVTPKPLESGKKEETIEKKEEPKKVTSKKKGKE